MTFLALSITSILFWMIYFTGPMGITLFIKNNVDKHIFGYELATQWVMNINPLVIIIGSPILGMFIQKLHTRGISISASTQFIWAFFFLALSFIFLSCEVLFSDKNGFCSIYWVTLYSITQAIAELLLGPLGYALIGRLAPKKLESLLMGTWMMVSGVAASLSYYFSDAMQNTPSINPLVTNDGYLSVFNHFVFWSSLSALLIYLVTRKIKVFLTSFSKAQLNSNTINL